MFLLRPIYSAFTSPDAYAHDRRETNAQLATETRDMKRSSRRRFCRRKWPDSGRALGSDVYVESHQSEIVYGPKQFAGLVANWAKTLPKEAAPCI